MHDDQCPQCIIRSAPNALSTPLEIKYLKVSETENLLDNQEELISPPLIVTFNSLVLFLEIDRCFVFYINDFRKMKENLFYFLSHILLNDRLIVKVLLKFNNRMGYGYRLIQMNQYLIRIKFVK